MLVGARHLTPPWGFTGRGDSYDEPYRSRQHRNDQNEPDEGDYVEELHVLTSATTIAVPAVTREILKITAEIVATRTVSMASWSRILPAMSAKRSPASRIVITPTPVSIPRTPLSASVFCRASSPSEAAEIPADTRRSSPPPIRSAMPIESPRIHSLIPLKRIGTRARTTPKTAHIPTTRPMAITCWRFTFLFPLRCPKTVKHPRQTPRRWELYRLWLTSSMLLPSGSSAYAL
jgi:hypothetical protein